MSSQMKDANPASPPILKNIFQLFAISMPRCGKTYWMLADIHNYSYSPTTILVKLRNKPCRKVAGTNSIPVLS